MIYFFISFGEGVELLKFGCSENAVAPPAILSGNMQTCPKYGDKRHASCSHIGSCLADVHVATLGGVPMGEADTLPTCGWTPADP